MDEHPPISDELQTAINHYLALLTFGDDTVYAQDGVRDHIDCGDGFDVAFLDPEDLESGCESVNPA